MFSVQEMPFAGSFTGNNTGIDKQTCQFICTGSSVARGGARGAIAPPFFQKRSWNTYVSREARGV